MDNKYDVIIVGSGPAGLGTAFELAEKLKNKKILLLDKEQISSGGLRNDCKQNYTYPIGFAMDYWKDEKEARDYLESIKKRLSPSIQLKTNLEKYKKRASKIGVNLLEIEQAHIGTDAAVNLINGLIDKLKELEVEVCLGSEMTILSENDKKVVIKNKEGKEFEVEYDQLVLALGRKGAILLQNLMDKLGVKYIDNIVDIGIRVETKLDNYSIVKDYYDPKFYFPDAVRTFCTNSGAAYVVQEKYETYYSVNGHALSESKESNGLANFAILKTIKLTDPVASGVYFAKILGEAAMQLSGGKPMMQRVGDFRMGKRSKRETFSQDLYDFEPTLASATPGDIGLAVPSRIMRDIWKAMKLLDIIVPGVLSPETIIYYPEIKTYGNKPEFLNNNFEVKDSIYMIGDGAGTSRGITGAWASGIRCAKGIIEKYM